MRFEDYKLIFIVVGLIGVLLISSATFGEFFYPSGGEQFSELYLLGPGHTVENYPFNVATGQNYSVYVDVINNMRSSTYMVLYVKMRNLTEQSPNVTMATPSSLPPLYEFRFVVQDNQTWESRLTFSISDVSINNNQSSIKQLTINDNTINVDKTEIWNANATMYYYQLFLELWIYDAQLHSFEYSNRFVSLELNLTRSQQSP